MEFKSVIGVITWLLPISTRWYDVCRTNEATLLIRLQAAQQSQGIQTLLEAEKEAAKIVQQARQYRVQRLKDARSEASKEIEAYKQAKEAEFRAFESSHAGTTSDAQTTVDKETELKLQTISQSYEQAKDTVVEKLLARVTLVNPELHRNLKKLEA
ncbi:putative V-type proton ATPase subunit G [Termitomyces sp. J132]|nr:putative V-type proton ATPase subunit G [Termitomyces sp. J132]